MGGVFFGVPPDLTIRLKDGLGINTFVETGTFKGATAEWASHYFPRVYTIEVMGDRHHKTSAMLANISNISFLFGDSRTVLSDLLPRLGAPAILWLDAHNPGDEADVKNTPDECPILRELEIISEDTQDHVILIDDLRCFADINRGKYWPSVEELDAKIAELFPEYSVYHHHDVFIAVPKNACEIVEKYIAETS